MPVRRIQWMMNDRRIVYHLTPKTMRATVLMVFRSILHNDLVIDLRRTSAVHLA